MTPSIRTFAILLLSISVAALTSTSVLAQSGGNSTSITGTVVDPSGAVVPNATVEVHNPVSQFNRSAVTDSKGNFTIPNVPFNPYHMTVSGEGFAAYAQDIDVRSLVPLNLKVSLQVSGSSEVVTVESAGGDLIENDPTFHTDVDKSIVDRLPLESQSSSLSSAGHPGHARHCGGLQRSVSRHGRPCGELLLRRRSARY